MELVFAIYIFLSCHLCEVLQKLWKWLFENLVSWQVGKIWITWCRTATKRTLRWGCLTKCLASLLQISSDAWLCNSPDWGWFCLLLRIHLAKVTTITRPYKWLKMSLFSHEFWVLPDVSERSSCYFDWVDVQYMQKQYISVLASSLLYFHCLDLKNK